MRNAFAQEITKLAGADPRVVLLMADIGNRLFNEYKAAFPDRFYNCGVAEQNMISMAAGMASEGFRPVCYTITPFVTARCLEQIRVDVCYHEMPVTIVGTGSGLSYASLGATHHSCEDIATLRALPGMIVMAPADGPEVRGSLQAVLAQDHPAYLRIGKKGEPEVHTEIPKLRIGKAIKIRNGDRSCILSTGNMLPTALEAAESTGSTVYSFHTIKPLDRELLASVFNLYHTVLTLEEHSLVGGLGSAVAEWFVDQPTPPAAKLLRLGTTDEFLHETSTQESAREHYSLTSKDIVEALSTS